MSVILRSFSTNVCLRVRYSYVAELFLYLPETYSDTEQMHREEHVCSSKCHYKI